MGEVFFQRSPLFQPQDRKARERLPLLAVKFRRYSPHPSTLLTQLTNFIGRKLNQAVRRIGANAVDGVGPPLRQPLEAVSVESPFHLRPRSFPVSTPRPQNQPI